MPRLRSRKALWLLALLTLNAQRAVDREWIAATLWPDQEREHSLASLRPVLSELRKALGTQASRVQGTSWRTLTMDLAGAVVDVLRFDKAIASGRQYDLAQAIELYRRPLLEDCQEEWIGPDRARREQECIGALQTLAEAAAETGDINAAIAYSRQAAALNPWSDALQRRLMELLARNNDINGAVQVYRAFAATLGSDPKATPDAETTSLYLRLRGQSNRSSVAALLMNTDRESKRELQVSGYLPHALTRLIGRQDEIWDALAKLRRSRVLTLTGTGGIGKTRLALAVAGEASSLYSDGAWLVALDSISDGALVASQIASVLRIREDGDYASLAAVTEHLQDKAALIVLDNCEHLLPSCAEIATHLLQKCPHLSILATSREALRVPGEVAWSVPALATPVPEHLPQERATLLRVLRGYDGVQLFVERAQSVDSSFDLTADNASAVAEICSRLQGIPLALELAAARVNAMTAGADCISDASGIRCAHVRQPRCAVPAADFESNT